MRPEINSSIRPLDAGARVVGVATVVDRDTGARQAVEAAGLGYRSVLSLADLSP